VNNSPRKGDGSIVKRYIPHIAISSAALLLALGHAIFPSIRIDVVTLTLLLIAILPWLGFIFKSVELPGGLKVEYPDLEKASQDAARVGLLSEPERRIEEAPYIAVAEQDPNLALAGLRIEIERRLREIAKKRGLRGERLGMGQLLRLLRTNEAISKNEDSVLSDLIGLLNNAVHGAEVDLRAAQWAIDVGPRLLAALDERISKEDNRSDDASS
jgi:hypothetical protein